MGAGPGDLHHLHPGGVSCSARLPFNPRAGAHTPSRGVLPQSSSCCSGALLGIFLCGEQPSSLLNEDFINL